MPASASSVYAWHMRRGAFERLAPPWEEARVVSDFTPPDVGRFVELEAPVLPGLRVVWVSDFTEVVPGERFRDVQRTGPFDHFDHVHLFEPAGPDGSVMEDRIQYRLPFGRLGNLVGGPIARRKLAATFAYRHRVLAGDLAVHARARGAQRILVTGASGLVGRALVSFLVGSPGTELEFAL